ncbi:hypothetical protein ACFGVR_17540 [Mucilaginibacter sp. AW1-3]
MKTDDFLAAITGKTIDSAILNSDNEICIYTTGGEVINFKRLMVFKSEDERQVDDLWSKMMNTVNRKPTYITCDWSIDKINRIAAEVLQYDNTRRIMVTEISENYYMLSRL